MCRNAWWPGPWIRHGLPPVTRQAHKQREAHPIGIVVDRITGRRQVRTRLPRGCPPKAWPGRPGAMLLATATAGMSTDMNCASMNGCFREGAGDSAQLSPLAHSAKGLVHLPQVVLGRGCVSGDQLRRTGRGCASKNPACAVPGGAASRLVSFSSRSRRAFSARSLASSPAASAGDRFAGITLAHSHHGKGRPVTASCVEAGSPRTASD